MKYYLITPIPKPRMTQSDKWKKRPCVLKYWAFKDQVKKLRIMVPKNGSHIIFRMPMPKSWSLKKRNNMAFTPHESERADLDNLLKALFDALFSNDGHIWDYRATKVWGYVGEIVIKNIRKGNDVERKNRENN